VWLADPVSWPTSQMNEGPLWESGTPVLNVHLGAIPDLMVE